MDSSPSHYVLPEVSAFLVDLKAQGVIAVQTPELAAHVQAELLQRLRGDVDAAQREEFLTPEEAEELYERFDEGDVPALEQDLRLRLPQLSDAVAAHLGAIKRELVER